MKQKQKIKFVENVFYRFLSPSLEYLLLLLLLSSSSSSFIYKFLFLVLKVRHKDNLQKKIYLQLAKPQCFFFRNFFPFCFCDGKKKKISTAVMPTPLHFTPCHFVPPFLLFSFPIVDFKKSTGEFFSSVWPLRICLSLSLSLFHFTHDRLK